jgi:PRTRC genetic system protein B
MHNDESFVATHALVFHELLGPSVRGRAAVITSHPVSVGHDGPLIGPGQALSVDDESRLLSILTRNTASHFAILPETVLAVGADRVLWFIPGKVRTMIVRATGKVRRLNVPWPTLVVDASRDELRVAAIPTALRPTPGTPLFHAPIANVDHNGMVCVGSAELPVGFSAVDIPGWESVIMDTAFSHTNQEHTLRLPALDGSCPANAPVDDGAHFGFWSGLHKSGAAVFPVEALVPMDTTLSEWIDGVTA